MEIKEKKKKKTKPETVKKQTYQFPNNRFSDVVASNILRIIFAPNFGIRGGIWKGFFQLRKLFSRLACFSPEIGK